MPIALAALMMMMMRMTLPLHKNPWQLLSLAPHSGRASRVDPNATASGSSEVDPNAITLPPTSPPATICCRDYSRLNVVLRIHLLAVALNPKKLLHPVNLPKFRQ